MVCCFFGHRDVPLDVEESLMEVLLRLVEEGCKELLGGNHGSFDRVALHILRKFKTIYPDISYKIVLAYMPAEGSDKEYDYTETLYPEGLEKVHPRYAISWRNNWMLNEAEVVVTYVTHSWGNAVKLAEKAGRKGKRVVNIAEPFGREKVM